MAIRLAKQTEASFTRTVIEFAKLNGWRTAHFRASINRRGKWSTAVQGDGAGFPDLILVRDRVVVAAELKMAKNAPTAEQIAWLAAFAQAGVQAFVWFPTDWDLIEATLRRVGTNI